MTYAADPRVDAYIDALPGWQQAICREVRDLVHAADPAVSETIKRTSQPYFVMQGNVCALLAARDHVNADQLPGTAQRLTPARVPRREEPMRRWTADTASA
jgi:hypothetical protein